MIDRIKNNGNANKKRALNVTDSGKHVNIFLVFSIIVIMVVLIIGSIISPDRDLSENENRYLTQLPELSLGNIIDGKFEAQLENYLSDQIIGRENWIKIMSNILEGIGYKDIKGVYLLDDGRLAERTTSIDFKNDRFENNLNEIVRLKSELSLSGGYAADPDISVMLVPTAAYSYRNYFNDSTDFDEEEAFRKAGHILGDMYIDLENELVPSVANDLPYMDTNDPELRTDCYYKTDHHWNYNGAHRAAEIYRRHVGLPEGKYDSEELTGEFMGTLYSKVLLNNRVRDSIEVPRDSIDQKVKVLIEGEEYDSIYFMDRLDKKDKYEVFFGGNYDIVRIKNEEKNASDKPKLLIIKDSYANSFVPEIMDEFSEITMVDTRYYRDSVKDLISKEGYDKVLVLYSITNFAEEKINLVDKALN